MGCHDLDFNELNCSDFRGIDTVRDIRRMMSLAPSAGEVKIWLLDEVHKLSNDGQNAALKILEDTPDHVYFFLCTTDPDKLLKTLRTRCEPMPVEMFEEESLMKLLRRVVKKEGVEVPEELLDSIVDNAQGSARFALVLLEKALSLDPTDRVAAVKAASVAQHEAIELCRMLLRKEGWQKVCATLRNLQDDPESVRWAVLGYANAILTKKKDHQAYVVLCAFENNFYDSKKAGLTRACYESIFG